MNNFSIKIISVSIIGASLLASCGTLPPPGPLECNDSQRLCFRGNVLDRAATRQTYGLQALEDYDSMYSVF